MLVKAIVPYYYPEILNFKVYAYNSWIKEGGEVAKPHYPARMLHRFVFKYGLPLIRRNSKEARLRFVSGHSIYFDTFPDYMFYEIIPLIWDCWPYEIKKVSSFFYKYNIKTAFFTSSQIAEYFHKEFPSMNIMHVSEGVDLKLYSQGRDLINRNIDILEVGRKKGHFFKSPLSENLHHVKTGNFDRVFKSDEEFREALANTKITVNVPRCDVDKTRAGNIETLTQRYWECMLSRVIMVGRAPKELTDLIGYNPVINWDGYDATPLVENILEHIEDYQNLVDRNYETALRLASWELRIRKIMHFLNEKGYSLGNYGHNT